MEREFLMGVDFNLYVDKSTYESWLNLLKGLVMAKERDSRYFRKSRNVVRTSKSSQLHASSGPSTRSYNSRPRVLPYRARSTSPGKSTPSLPLSRDHSDNPEPISPTPCSGSKRSAEDAFSPTSATFAQMPSKRPVSISLQIPEYVSVNNGPHSYSPLEGLQSFATMSLASPARSTPQSGISTAGWSSANVTRAQETLVQPYPLSEDKRSAAPQVRVFPFYESFTVLNAFT